jgi:hypothetical protein
MQLLKMKGNPIFMKCNTKETLYKQIDLVFNLMDWIWKNRKEILNKIDTHEEIIFPKKLINKINIGLMDQIDQFFIECSPGDLASKSGFQNMLISDLFNME